MEKERLRLMVKLCRYYYQDGLNQQELAKKFGISRPQVSRILAGAKEEGIVEIKIHNPFSEESDVEEQLMERYQLKDVILTDTTKMTGGQSLTRLARAGAFYLENAIKHDDVIGLMAGESVQQVVQQLAGPNKQRGVRVIPLVGGIGMQSADLHANANVIELAGNMNVDHYVLNTPAIVSSLEMKSQLIQEEGIRQVIDAYEKLQLALVGIGEITEDATFFRFMHLSHDDLEEIKAAGAVCSIGKTFLNEKGEEVAKEISERMIAISSENLKQTPLVIAVAAGPHKVKAIQAGLQGKWMDVLITDLQTGKALI